jgi:C4-type Zn-finger protein
MAAAKTKKFRSNFGASYVRCSDYIVAPERSEYRDTRHIVHAWLCSKCGFRFEIIVPTGETPPSEIISRIRDIQKFGPVARNVPERLLLPCPAG